MTTVLPRLQLISFDRGAMIPYSPLSKQVDEFILNEIDTIPHLEALLLVWKSRPNQWTVEEMASELYLDAGTARSILQDLARRGILNATQGSPEWYSYESISCQRDDLIKALDATYRRELIRISRLIHSKAAPAIREFARAFRFTKNRE